MSNQLKSGAILSYIYLFITILIALIYTPIIIRLLGQAEYGLYTMIGSVSAYLSIMDMGLGNAIIRYTARNRALGDEDKQSKLNGMFLMLYGFIGILTLIIGVIVYNSVDSIFGAGLSVEEINKAKTMVIIIIVTFALSFPLTIFSSYIEAYEKFVVSKLVAIVRTIFIPLLTIPFLLANYGSVTMVLISSIINISCLIFNMMYSFYRLKIKFTFGKINTSLLKEILLYSFFIFLGIIVDQVNWNTGQLILGAVHGTIAVAVFSVAIQFIKIYLQFSTSISGLFLPKVSIMVANKVSKDVLSAVMIKFGRIQYCIISMIMCGFILFGKYFISFWAGEDFGNAYYMVLIIMLPMTIPLVQTIGLSILQAKNLQGFRSIVLILIAIFNIILSLLLVEKYNGVGVALGTGISYLLGNAITMNIYYYKKIGINIPLFWKNILQLTVPILCALLVGFGLNSIITNSSLLVYTIKIIFFILLYLTFMWGMGFNRYEKNLLLSIVKHRK